MKRTHDRDRAILQDELKKMTSDCEKVDLNKDYTFISIYKFYQSLKLV